MNDNFDMDLLEHLDSGNNTIINEKENIKENIKEITGDIVISLYDREYILSDKYKISPNVPTYLSVEQRKIYLYCYSRLIDNNISKDNKDISSINMLNSCKYATDKIINALLSGITNNLNDIEIIIYDEIPSFMKIDKNHIVNAC